MVKFEKEVLADPDRADIIPGRNELMKNMTPGERARALRKKWNNYDADKPDPNAPKGDGDGSTQNVQEQEEQPPEEPKKEIWIPPPIKKLPTPPKTLWEQLTVRTVKSTSARSEPEIAALRSARRLRKSMTERSSKPRCAMRPEMPSDF